MVFVGLSKAALVLVLFAKSYINLVHLFYNIEFVLSIYNFIIISFNRKLIKILVELL